MKEGKGGGRREREREIELKRPAITSLYLRSQCITYVTALTIQLSVRCLGGAHCLTVYRSRAHKNRRLE